MHQALLAGLLSHVGLKDGSRNEYQGARNAKFQSSPAPPCSGNRRAG